MEYMPSHDTGWNENANVYFFIAFKIMDLIFHLNRIGKKYWQLEMYLENGNQYDKGRSNFEFIKGKNRKMKPEWNPVSKVE